MIEHSADAGLAWKVLWDSAWGRFERQFKGILSDLSRHAEVVDKEANTQNILNTQKWIRDVRSWRDGNIADITRLEKEQSLTQYQWMLSWLEMKEAEQDEIFQLLSNNSRHGTCEWIVRNPTIKNWMRRQREQLFLWVKGKPGSGMSYQDSKT